MGHSFMNRSCCSVHRRCNPGASHPATAEDPRLVKGPRQPWLTSREMGFDTSILLGSLGCHGGSACGEKPSLLEAGCADLEGFSIPAGQAAAQARWQQATASP